MSSEELKNLEQRIDALIASCEKLKSENTNLKQEKESLVEEHAKLVRKTQTARSRIETMIGRLKALERS